MVIKIDPAKQKVFILAILLSVIWHIFWLSTIKIVIVRSHAKPVKFSKVSFLGSILPKVTMELSAQPKTHSFLEERYLDSIEDRSGLRKFQTKVMFIKPNISMEPSLVDYEKFISLSDAAVSGSKAEPIQESD